NFNKAIAKAGVRKIRIHDLRHSHASLLINNGVNIVAVSKRLGHSNIEQTLQTYTHLLEKTDSQMLEIISGLHS
ncbi:MAG: tyrosine-type recombinase/integrase, partial [Solobacterium sp.]|nr:tyrosine-type recombinase/integrase [Solobacterium sp.]